MPKRRTRRFIRKRTFIMIIIALVSLSNIFNTLFHEYTKESNSIPTGANKTNSSINVSVPVWSKPSMRGSINYYELVSDTNYHYEFRFEYNTSNANDDPRLMILLNGSVRTCIDYWDFSVGRRILAHLHNFHFLVLVICSKKRTYDPDGPIQKNLDVLWIYTALQKWMNEVYYKEFQRYPRLYIHGISRGSKIASLLCRVLPIQGQLFTIYPGHWDGLLPKSDYPIELQKRLQLEPVFANWFYFDFCYNPTSDKKVMSDLCPFQNDRKNYQPVPPTYFLHAKNDRLFNQGEYTAIIQRMREDALEIGGKLLSHEEGVKFQILHPLNATPTLMQEMFNRWHSKPHASRIFYEHYVDRRLYEASDETRRTCNCLPTDFRYFQLYPNITRKWSKQRQNEYRDYATDIELYVYFFCEDVCGDLHTDHAMLSRDLDKMLQWLNRMDLQRETLLTGDYVSRPVRIWMYDKNAIMKNVRYVPPQAPDYVNIGNEYQMYSPEYYLQDYLLQLKSSSNVARHNLQWAENPILADYFIIPSDYTYHYFYHNANTMERVAFQNLVHKLNDDYFRPLLTNVRTMYPYWNIAKQPDQMGSNHILTILTGTNMGIFYNNTQNLLKNVIQFVFTGLRQDLLPPDTPPPCDYRGTTIVYRHGYDVVLPQFTRVQSDINIFRNTSVFAEKKTRLFFFAGNLHHSITPQSARPLLLSVWNNLNDNRLRNMITRIQKYQFDTMTILENYQKPDEYIKSVQSSVFMLCPEGFFPWSPRLYEAIQTGAIPLVLADNIVLPFERYIDWLSISAKMNVSNTKNIVNFVDKIEDFENYMKQKLSNAQPYLNAFKWPYSAIGENEPKKHVFLSDEDGQTSLKNVFDYISLELRCRHLEQFYGLTSDIFSKKSIKAQRQACRNHPTICPCDELEQSVAFREYL